MKKFSIVLTAALLVLASCNKEESTIPTPPEKATLTLVSINPAAGTMLTGTEQIVAVLDYNYGEDFNAGYIMEVGLMFKNVTGGYEFGGNDPNDVKVTSKEGTVTISYDLSDAWSDVDYQHPLTIKFNLSSSEPGSFYWPIHASSEEVVYGN